MQYTDEMAEILYRTGCVKFGEFVLSSGKKSSVYVDLRTLLSHPREFRRVVELSIREVSLLEFDVICGVESSGIPLATAMALEMEMPLAYVRKERKEHGTQKMIEGEVREGQKALLVDDVATTGTSLLHGVKALESQGLAVENAFVIVDRGQGAANMLKSHKVKLICLARLNDVIKALKRMGFIDGKLCSQVLDHLGGPGC